MRIGRDKMVWMALVTLAEQVELARNGPLRPSYGVRLALAVLHEFSDGDREPFADFWRTFRGGQGRAWSDTMAQYERVSYLQMQLRGVMRAVGVEPCVAAEQMLSNAARRTVPPRAERASIRNRGRNA